MPNETHVNAPTRHVEVSGRTYAYRRFGNEAGIPMLFLQHFRGGLDHWDPLITDDFAQDRPVILFDNAGVAGSSGDTPETIDDMAHHAAVFLGALDIGRADVLGFSMGGYVAQTLTLRHQRLVRRLILVGTGPRAGEPAQDPRVLQHAGKPVPELDDFLFLFFAPSETSQAAGRAFWERRHQRTVDVDPPSSPQTMKAQVASFMEWRQVRGERFAELKTIRQPTLVVNGANDVMIPTINSYTLAQHIPNAQLIVYPDSGHAAHFQYPKLFLQHAKLFLDM